MGLHTLSILLLKTSCLNLLVCEIFSLWMTSLLSHKHFFTSLHLFPQPVSSLYCPLNVLSGFVLSGISYFSLFSPFHPLFLPLCGGAVGECCSGRQTDTGRVLRTTFSQMLVTSVLLTARCPQASLSCMNEFYVHNFSVHTSTILSPNACSVKDYYGHIFTIPACGMVLFLF